MTKQEFLDRLRRQLSHLPPEDIQKQLQFYSEMIDDRMEDGMTEEEAVAGIEFPEQPPKAKKQSLPAWALILLIVGSPIWFSLAVAAISVMFSLYVVLWSVVVTLYTVPITLGACAAAGIGMTVVSAFIGQFALCLVWLGMGLLCAGLCMFTGYLCTLLAKAVVRLTKKIIDLLFQRKEAAL